MSRSRTQVSAPLGQAGAEPQRNSYRFVIAGLTLLLNACLGLSFFVIAPVTPLMMGEYGINRSMASLATGLVILVQAALGILASMLVGRYPLKVLIVVGWLLAGAPTLTFLATSFPILLGLRLIYGLGLTVLFPASGALVAQWFRPRELPLINGINIAVGSLGIAFSTFTAVPLAGPLGWKGALSLFGAVSLVGAGCWIALGKVKQPVQRARHYLSVKEVWGVLRSRTTLLLAMADAGPLAQYVALSAWLPTFYYEVRGMPLSQAGYAVGLLPLIGIFSLMLAGIVPMHVSLRRPLLIIPGILTGLAGLGSFLLGNPPAMYVALVLLGFSYWFYLPILFTIPMELPNMPPERVALVWAAVVTPASVLGFLAPLVVGALTDLSGSYVPGFTLFAVLAWSLVVAGFLLPETGGKRLGGVGTADASSR